MISFSWLQTMNCFNWGGVSENYAHIDQFCNLHPMSTFHANLGNCVFLIFCYILLHVLLLKFLNSLDFVSLWNDDDLDFDSQTTCRTQHSVWFLLLYTFILYIYTYIYYGFVAFLVNMLFNCSTTGWHYDTCPSFPNIFIYYQKWMKNETLCIRNLFSPLLHCITSPS